MAEYQVTCINKPDRNSRHEHITHIGNIQANWRMTREQAIAQIESKTNAFYTVERISGARAYIGVVKEAGKAPYLRTYADHVWNDNLLALAECGANCRIVG